MGMATREPPPGGPLGEPGDWAGCRPGNFQDTDPWMLQPITSLYPACSAGAIWFAQTRRETALF